MYKKTTLLTIILLVLLGIGLTACSQKAKSTATQLPAIQATTTRPPAVQATATQPPAIQATATQPSAAQATATQPPAVQATATQPPTVQASVTPATGVDGQTLLNERCSVCHNLNRVTSQRLTAAQWNQIVSRMVQNGAQLTAAEQQVLVEYLAKTYGP
jgi:cytochrome c5